MKRVGERQLWIVPRAFLKALDPGNGCRQALRSAGCRWMAAGEEEEGDGFAPAWADSVN